MFNCNIRHSHKNADKIEGMASWFILGGVLPLAVEFIEHHQQYDNYDPFFTSDCTTYLWVIAMGVASLLVKRTSISWQGIVSLGVLGLLLAAGLNMQLGDISGTLWPIMVLLIIFKQYRHDMKAARAQKLE